MQTAIFLMKYPGAALNPDRQHKSLGHLGLGFDSSLGIRHSSFPRFLFAIAMLLVCMPSVLVASAIPDRPEKLVYPPLVYDAPVPEKFRVQLKAGPVA